MVMPNVKEFAIIGSAGLALEHPAYNAPDESAGPAGTAVTMPATISTISGTTPWRILAIVRAGRGGHDFRQQRVMLELVEVIS
jgi:hypothetical protein